MPLPDERSIDLHTHTTASDGDLSPTRLIELAKEAGLAAIAVTDHDTTDGLAEAIAAGERLGVEVIPGIELSAQIDHGQCHILGLGIDPNNVRLLERLRDIQERRRTRNAQMVDKINALPELKERGVQISMADVERAAGGEIVARPHFARVLMDKGLVGSIQEAFDRYVAEGKPGHVEKAQVSQQEAIDLIHQAGGVAILAHPNNLKRDTPAATEAYIVGMRALGLDGIEARYNLHEPEHNAFYLELAERHGLLTSGGSDFHGKSVKPKVFLGHVEKMSPGDSGRLPTPRSVLTAIQERLTHS